MGFQSVQRASEARSLLDCVALTSLVHPAAASTVVSTAKATNIITHPSPSDPSLLQPPVLMPWVGYGTYRLGQRHARTATFQALNVGYRQIDTAFIYGGQTTEIEVGKAIQDALEHNIISSREELFITTKQWREYHGYEKSMECLNLSLDRLGVDYVDCWMMHWPGPCWKSKPRQEKEFGKSKGTKREHVDAEENDPWLYAKDGMGKEEITVLRAETWRAMEDAYRQGKARSIAVSNFTIQHLELLKKSAKLWPPAVNQVECHPYYPQNELLEYCKREGIVVQAYASLGGQDGTKAKWKVLGGKLIESEPVLAASTHLSNSQRTVSAAQVLLRWALQRNCAIVPKTSSPARMKENANVFGFVLTDEEMIDISKLANNLEGKKGRLCWRTEPLRLLEFE